MHNVPTFVIALIIISYIVIAAQFFIAARNSDRSEGRTAMFMLLSIFIFCAVCGYLPRLLEIPSHFELITHVSLVVMSWWFIITNQAAHIMKALR